MRLTCPGPTDLHWMVVLIGQHSVLSYDFFEDKDRAELAAGALLADTPGVSVYVSEIKLHGEHLRRAPHRAK